MRLFNHAFDKGHSSIRPPLMHCTLSPTAGKKNLQGYVTETQRLLNCVQQLKPVMPALKLGQRITEFQASLGDNSEFKDRFLPQKTISY